MDFVLLNIINNHYHIIFILFNKFKNNELCSIKNINQYWISEKNVKDINFFYEQISDVIFKLVSDLNIFNKYQNNDKLYNDIKIMIDTSMVIVENINDILILYREKLILLQNINKLKNENKLIIQDFFNNINYDFKPYDEIDNDVIINYFLNINKKIHDYLINTDITNKKINIIYELNIYNINKKIKTKVNDFNTNLYMYNTYLSKCHKSIS